MSKTTEREEIAERIAAIGRRLNDDLSDEQLRTLQLHMNALDQWARLVDSRLPVDGHDHDHMNDHDHSLRAEPGPVVTTTDVSQEPGKTR